MQLVPPHACVFDDLGYCGKGHCLPHRLCVCFQFLDEVRYEHVPARAPGEASVLKLLEIPCDLAHALLLNASHRRDHLEHGLKAGPLQQGPKDWVWMVAFNQLN